MSRTHLLRDMVWLSLLPLVAGCQSQRMVRQHLGFETAVTDLYRKHVLYNLAMRDQGDVIVQMTHTAFAGSLTDSVTSSGQVAIFTNPQTTGSGGTNVTLNAWQNLFQPSVTSATSTGLSISSVPSDNQDMIRALYDEQVNQPEGSRMFRRGNKRLEATRSYCWIRAAEGEYYYVPFEKRREFADFVHKVCFYKFVPPPPQVASPQAPATAPAVADARP